MPPSSKIAEDIDYSRFLPDGNSPLDDELAKIKASEVEPWQVIEYHDAPEWCRVPKNGEVWDPVIGGGPFRPYMVPKGVPISDGALLMMRLFSVLPFKFDGASLADLQKIHGFTKTGTIQRKDSGADGTAKTPMENGST
ncbi:hypothetical protein V498_10212, partial [Pseudogymnoascus sp. VKM F-4517 (FW-2822)]